MTDPTSRPRSRPGRPRPAPARADQPGAPLLYDGERESRARTPSPRAIAVRVLTDVLAGSYAAPLLDEALSRARLEARDSGLVTHLVYGTLRHLPTLEAALAPLLRGETAPKARALLLAGTFEKLVLGTPPHAVVNEYVALAKTGFGPPALVNAVLRRAALPAQPVPLLPGWLEADYRAAYGPEAGAVLDSLVQPQPLWLRLTEAGRESLEKEGSELGEAYGDVYRVALNRPLRQTEAYLSGWAQPINPASLACVLALGEVQGVRVLDLAGGAGVKAAMLAAGGAEVTSVDLIAGKADSARHNLERLGLDAYFVTADLRRDPRLDPAPAVLLDAPCTGSGTLRAHPEIRLRLSEGAPAQMASVQGELLATAGRLTQPGGTLVYSVCSVTPEEGPQVVAAFLAAHPDFAAQALPELPVPVVPAGDGVLTVPLGGLDGFFIARLGRQG